MWEFILGVFAGLFIYKWWTFPRGKSVVPGINSNVFLDHKVYFSNIQPVP